MKIRRNGILETQPISAVTLPLPTGAATEATLSNIDSKLNSLGQKTMANSVPVVFASDQTVDVSSTELSLAINDFEIPGFSTQISGSDDGYARVVTVDGYGSLSVKIREPQVTNLYDIQDTVIYIGTAQVGSLPHENVWTITKTVLVDGDPIEKKTTGVETAIWNNRTTEIFN